jgi:hypothetical protein
MVLQADDELRHEWDSDPLWRESWYWNFSDATAEMGGWLYLWVVPNQSLKSGMLVCFYHGVAADLDSTEVAWKATGHLHRGANGSWVYCYKRDVADLIARDLDDVELCGLAMQRLEPLKKYHLTFADGANARFDLNCEFTTLPWDFADNVHPTPRWLAKNRYHRGWKASGDVVIADTTYKIRTTGDSDHSWGTRDSGIFEKNSLKTYALQSADGRLSVKAQMLGDPGRELPRGYISIDGDMQAVRSIQEESRYNEKGLMYDIALRVEDINGRVITAHMGELYAAVAGPGPNVGYEGAGVWTVPGWGTCPGIASCWWATGITPEQLHQGRAGKTLIYQ